MARKPTSVRGGFALLAVLWICVGIAGLSWLITSSGRDAVGPARNRIAEIRATWTVSACLASVQSVVSDQVKRASQDPVRDSTDWDLSKRVLRVGLQAGFPCKLRIAPTGARFDVNALNERSLFAVLRAAGLSKVQAESGAAAVADWRDVDDVPRAMGAERSWYLTQNRPTPSNRPFASPAELHLVKGLEHLPQVDSLLGTDAGPIALDVAPPGVLALLPGFSLATASVVDSMRKANRVIRSFQSIAAALPPALRGTFDSAEASLGSTVVFAPTGWILTLTASNGQPPVTHVLEVHVTMGAMGLMIGERRSWLQ